MLIELLLFIIFPNPQLVNTFGPIVILMVAVLLQRRGSPRNRPNLPSIVLFFEMLGRVICGSSKTLILRPECVDIQSLLCKTIRVEDDSCVAFETLSDHPSQRDLRQLVSHFVLDCAATDVCVATSEPYLEEVGLGCRRRCTHVSVTVDMLVGCPEIRTESSCWFAARLIVQCSNVSGEVIMYRSYFPATIVTIAVLKSGDLELGPTFIQSHCVAKVEWLVFRCAAQGQFSGDKTHRGDGVEDADLGMDQYEVSKMCFLRDSRNVR